MKPASSSEIYEISVVEKQPDPTAVREFIASGDGRLSVAVSWTDDPVDSARRLLPISRRVLSGEAFSYLDPPDEAG